MPQRFESPMPEEDPVLDALCGGWLPAPGTRLQGDNDQRFH